MSDYTPPPPPPPPPGGMPGGAGAGVPGAPPLAEMGPRVIAFLIDIGIAIGGYIAVLIVGGILGAISDALGALFFLVGYLALLGYSWFYLPYMEGTTGQTIGKKQQGIKVVSQETGQPVGFGMAFVRYLLNGIVCSLGWFLAFFDTDRQTLGDKVSKGITVKA